MFDASICVLMVKNVCFFIASRNLLHFENAVTNAWMSSCLQSSSTSEIESESLSLISTLPPMAHAGMLKKITLRSQNEPAVNNHKFKGEVFESFFQNELYDKFMFFSFPHDFKSYSEKKGRHSKACGALVPRDLPRMWLK